VRDGQDRTEAVLIAAVLLFALTGWVGLRLRDAPERVRLVEPPIQPLPGKAAPSDPVGWFQTVRPHCNAVEVETHMSWQPAPPTPEGDMYKAACYALAGRIDRAREAIEALPSERRYEAAGVVFEAGHPAADAGDDIAAGPLMELVVDYWPNHYMALYHAGAARFELGDDEIARGYLERFLAEYRADDGWTARAGAMLAELAERT